jgi:hypothetical protein
MATENTLDRLRERKRKLRQSRREMSLPEKVKQVIALQRIEVEMIRRRRPLSERERVWPLDRHR